MKKLPPQILKKIAAEGYKIGGLLWHKKGNSWQTFVQSPEPRLLIVWEVDNHYRLEVFVLLRAITFLPLKQGKLCHNL